MVYPVRGAIDPAMGMPDMRSRKATLSPFLLLWSLMLYACAGDESPVGEESGGVRSTPVTVAAVARDEIVVSEESLGTVRAKQAPTVAAEVSARVVAIAVDEGDPVTEGQVLAELDAGDFRLARDRSAAEIGRLEALIDDQRRQLERNRSMLERDLVARSVVDTAEAQLRALQGQLAVERANLLQAERDIARTRVVAPVNGRIEERLADIGDWAATGTALFRIATGDLLRAQLPFPEYVSDRLRPGLPVRLTSSAAPDAEVTGRIAEIRPTVGTAGAVIVIAEFENPGGWRPGASVSGSVELERRADTIVVPEVAVVQRPAGMVVYVVEDGRAHAREVRIGVRQEGLVEIVAGLEGNERVVVDGAGFLTDGAPVEVREAEAAP